MKIIQGFEFFCELKSYGAKVVIPYKKIQIYYLLNYPILYFLTFLTYIEDEK